MNNEQVKTVLLASKYFENIVDQTGFNGIVKLEAINRGVTALTDFDPLRSMGMQIGNNEIEDEIEDEKGNVIRQERTVYFASKAK